MATLLRRSRLASRVHAPLAHVASRGFIAGAAFKLAQKAMPKISETERVALGCGSVGFDRDIFSGSPSLKKLLDTYTPRLSAEEESFLANEVETLCTMLDDHQVTVDKDLPPDAWDYMRNKGFFAMKIPKEWGGKGFSTHAVSCVLAKLGSHSFDANATVAVPNSLGPGELLVRYGTDAQKTYFLPRLADGTLIPCFGLTGPHSGSDATSLIGSTCVVQRGRDGELGVLATFRKRYITLAPVAGVVGVGLDLKDPDGLLEGSGGEGFTVALLERNHPGLRMGPRHMPLNSAFMNGTVEGDDVWIPMNSILGGQASLSTAARHTPTFSPMRQRISPHSSSASPPTRSAAALDGTCLSKRSQRAEASLSRRVRSARRARSRRRWVRTRACASSSRCPSPSLAASRRRSPARDARATR